VKHVEQQLEAAMKSTPSHDHNTSISPRDHVTSGITSRDMSSKRSNSRDTSSAVRSSTRIQTSTLCERSNARRRVSDGAAMVTRRDRGSSLSTLRDHGSMSTLRDHGSTTSFTLRDLLASTGMLCAITDLLEYRTGNMERHLSPYVFAAFILL